MQTEGLTQYYLVKLLCRFVRPHARIPFNDSDLPLALRLKRALESTSPERRERLRNLGDFSLFVSGFFSDSLTHGCVDVDYYISMGEYAYGTLAQVRDQTFGETFAELSRNFVGFADVLAHVCERTSLASSPNLLRMWERFARTGSSRDFKRLLATGKVPILEQVGSLAKVH